MQIKSDLMNFKEVNALKAVKIFSAVSLLLTNLMLIATFLKYYSLKGSMKNPLIPEYLPLYAYEPYISKGLTLAIGLLVFTILKTLKQDLLVGMLFVLLLIVNQFIY